ncbi:MAG TPA: CopG family antitoxin [Chloroflexota bacterium]|jgi:hypothetical protein
MSGRKAQAASRIPKFANEAEAAAFWDTHSPLDYPEEFQEVDVKFTRPLVKRGLTVKLADETIAELRDLARARGVGPSTLARMWIIEHLRAERQRHGVG